MNFLTLFICLSILNVILSTIRSLATIKSGKTLASLINGIYYSYYTIVVVYTVADYSLFAKCMVTFVCNLIGVYVVKYIEEKMRKDRLWKIEVSCKNRYTERIVNKLKHHNISCDYTQIDNRHSRIVAYCKTQQESSKVAKVIKEYNCKYFITENKGVLF